MAKNKRKYGDAWKDIEIDEASNDAVFDKFFKPPPVVPVGLPDIGLPDSGKPETNSLPVEKPLVYQKNSLPDMGSLPDSGKPTINLMASLPDAKGYTKLWHQMTDHLYKQLTTAEQSVHVQLFRLSWGYGKPTCFISLSTLAGRVGIARSAVQRAITGLLEKGLVVKRQIVIGKGEQGIEYEIIPPPALLASSGLPDIGKPESGNIKEKHILKENTQTQKGVRVGSKFSLEECKRYAEHLNKTGQGITNPGGYATKIYRSGEADALVEKFINPTPTLDISKCPDCEGKGYYFPDPSKPEMKRCTHERLQM